jgi:hypothetical protein
MACRLLVNKIMKDYFFNKLVEGVFLDKGFIYYTEEKIYCGHSPFLGILRNLVVPAHRSLAMSQSFVVFGYRVKKDDSFHDESLFCRKRFY